MEDTLNKKILTNGCSFSADEFAWPSYIQSELKYNLRNLAHHGAGNTYIRRQVQTEVLKNPNFDFAIIQWSTIDRWDYPFYIYDKNDTPLINHISKDGIDVEGKVGYFRMGTNVNKKSKHFYQNYYSIYGQLLETLENIYFTQLFLEKHKIPYFMVTIANFMTTNVSFDIINNISSINGDLIKQRTKSIKIEEIVKTFHTADLLKDLIQKINWDKFQWTTDFKINNFGDGFTEYLISKGEKFENGGNHPSDRQHKNFFNDVIKNRLEIEL